MSDYEDMVLAADLLRNKRILPDDEGFVSDIESRLSGPVDPSTARHHLLPYSQEAVVNLRGAYNPSNHPIVQKYLDDHGNKRKLTFDPKTVNTIHRHNTPEVWAHEYRHKNYPNLSEKQVREIDLVAVKGQQEIDNTIRMLANSERKRVPSEAIASAEQVFKRFLKQLDSHNKVRQVIKAELDRLGIDQSVDEFIKNSNMQKFINEFNEYKDWEDGLVDRNKARAAGEDESVLDTIRKAVDRLRVFDDE